jgi:hypothetical protein
MASGAQLPPGPSASATAISSPGDRDQRRLDQEALCFLLPLPLRKASPSAQPRSRLRGARQPRAASFPAPSARGPLVPRRGAARAPRASARVPTVAGAQTPQPSSPRPVPCDWRGLLDEGRLHGHLQLALGREARLWRGVPSQVRIPARARLPRRGGGERRRGRTGSTCTRAHCSAPCRPRPSPGVSPAAGTWRESLASRTWRASC